MKNDLARVLFETLAKEKKLLERAPRPNAAKAALYKKIPVGLRTTLESAFTKAFYLVFQKGTAVIEKTFDKENTAMEYEAGNYVVDRFGSRKSIRRLEKAAGKSSLANSAATTATGLGLGLLGLGLPDIPLMVGTLLKGLYEIALHYGFSYETKREQVYLLRLIRTALVSGEERQSANRLLEQEPAAEPDLPAEIASTAKVLSDALLVEKFIQGVPIVGVVGGVVNHMVYKRVSELARVKFKKRYLLKKQREKQPQ